MKIRAIWGRIWRRLVPPCSLRFHCGQNSNEAPCNFGIRVQFPNILSRVNPVTAANQWTEESVPRFDTHDPPVPPLSPLRHSHSFTWEASHRARAKKSPSNFFDLETAPQQENPRVPGVPPSLFTRWHEMRLSIVYQSFWRTGKASPDSSRNPSLRSALGIFPNSADGAHGWRRPLDEAAGRPFFHISPEKCLPSPGANRISRASSAASEQSETQGKTKAAGLQNRPI